MLLYVIRHGDPTYSPDALTPKGCRQAEAVGRRLAKLEIDRVFSSPLNRARQTAQPLCELLGIQPEIEDWTSENHVWKDFTQTFPDGRKHWEFARQNTDFLTADNARLGNQDWKECDCIQDLNLEQGCRRLQDASDHFLGRLGYQRQGNVYKITRPNDQKIALFCHEGFSMHWFPLLLQIPPHLFWAAFGITHTGVSVFQFSNNPDGVTAPRALCINDISHLYADNLPTTFQNRFPY